MSAVSNIAPFQKRQTPLLPLDMRRAVRVPRVEESDMVLRRPTRRHAPAATTLFEHVFCLEEEEELHEEETLDSVGPTTLEVVKRLKELLLEPATRGEEAVRAVQLSISLVWNGDADRRDAARDEKS